MKSVLLKLAINGIKSIDKKIELEFYKSTLQRKFDNSDSHVKAIYGPNGAGKTGIVYAVEILRNILLDPSYLTLNNANGSLYNLINQISKELDVRVVFAMITDDDTIDNIYSYEIILKRDDVKYEIYKEELKQLVGLKINAEDKYKVIYTAECGKIKTSMDEKNKNLESVTMNLLKNQTVSSIFFDKYSIFTEKKWNAKLETAISALIYFANSIEVLLQGSDRNYISLDYIESQIDAINNIKNNVDDKTFLELLNRDRIIIKDITRIAIEDYSEYENYVKRLTNFIKVFKDDLVDIKINKETNKDFYECSLELMYEDGKTINLKYESTGIKKIVDLFSAFCDIEKGFIVFIDEFDANIHDVLLVKLVQYVMQYSSGQLIFTTHNLGPMDVLESGDKSIDFLSPDSRIVSWTKNGNYKASAQYSKGLIKYSPFNIEPFSFLGVFGEDE